MRLLSLLLVAILLGPAALAASPPTGPAWSPATAPASIQAFAFAADGSVAVAGLAGAQSQLPPIGGIPQPNPPASTDMRAYDFARGARWNVSCTGPCSGKTAVALSKSGDWLLAGSNAASENLRLYQRDASSYVKGWGSNPQLPGGITHVALSEDASIVAAIAGTSDRNNLSAFSRDGTKRFSFPPDAGTGSGHNGRLLALAVSGDGAWVVVGGRLVQGSNVTGIVYLLSFNGLVPAGGIATLPSPVTSLAVDRSGTYIVAGTSAGSFANIVRIDGAGTLSRTLVDAPTPVRDVDISKDDGLTVAVAHGAGVSAYRRDRLTGTFTRLWQSNLTGGATDVAVSGDGTMIVAATPSGSFGFVPHLTTPLYTVSGGTGYAGLSSNGRRVVFASNSTVAAFTHTPGLKLDRVDEKGAPVAAPTPVAVNPGETAVFRIAVENNGTAPDTGEIVLPADAAYNVVANRTAYSVRPGERWLATIQITPGNALPTTYDAVVRAVSASSGATQNITLQYTVGATAGVAIAYVGKTNFVVRPGEVVTVDFAVRNVGNEGAEFTLATEQNPSSGTAWGLDRSPATATFVSREASSPARLTVTVPASVRDGTTNDVRLVAKIGQRNSIPLDLSFIVNPIIAANATSDALARLVTSGNAGWFNLTVKNTGTIRATYHVTWDPIAASPRTVVWNTEVIGLNATGLLTLNPGESRPLQVKLLAPQNAQPGNSALLHMYVRDFVLGHDRVKITEYLNLSATVVPRGPGISGGGSGVVLPGPGFALLAVAVVATAILVRRRSA